jgi:hypothetical protein
MPGARSAAVLTCVVLSVGISGCSSGSGSGGAGSAEERAADAFGGLSAKEVALKATDEMLHLRSVHIAGKVTNEGETVAMDVSVDNEGNCAGTVTIRGGTAEIIATGGDQYIRGDEAFWKSTAGAQASYVLRLLDGRWAKVPAAEGGSFAEVCSIEKFLQGLDRDGIDATAMSRGQVEDVGGIEALEILSDEEDGTGHVWIATEGPPYMLKLQIPGSEEALFFTEFDEPVAPEVPAKADVFDMSAAG